MWIDFLHQKTRDRFQRDPDLLYEELKIQKTKWVVIDEIQKVPEILDVIHRIIETKEFNPPHFALTGSSARKLKHGNSNLLAGRAFIRQLTPLTHTELENAFDLNAVLEFGALPKIFTFSDPNDRRDYLEAYALTYLNEEVWAEHLIRNIDPFRKFLEIAAQANGQIINYANISRDTHASEKTIKIYFQILEDTLMGFFLEPFHKSIRKRQIQSPKFYLFDTGVQRALARNLSGGLAPGTYEYGKVFEHFIICEIMRMSNYQKKEFRFSFFNAGGEIELIIDRPRQPRVLIEIKSKVETHEEDTAYLRSAMADFQPCKAYCLSLDPHKREVENVEYVHWRDGLDAIFSEPLQQ